MKPENPSNQGQPPWDYLRTAPEQRKDTTDINMSF